MHGEVDLENENGTSLFQVQWLGSGLTRGLGYLRLGRGRKTCSHPKDSCTIPEEGIWIKAR